MRPLLLGLVTLLVAGSSAAASGPISIRFDRPAAAPHTRVVGTTVPNRTLRRSRKRPLKVYLAHTPPVRLGRLVVDRRGRGRLSFLAPNVPPGRYRVQLRGLRGRPSVRDVGSFDIREGAPVRTCEQAVSGNLGDDWLSHAQTVGPAHMIGFGTEAERDRVTGQYAMKVLLVLDRGPRVTLSVAPEERERVALAYIPTRFNRHRVVDEDAAVTFEPCPEKDTTQFNGGFVFREPMCAHLELTVEGQPPVPLSVALGKPCPDRRTATLAPHPRIFLTSSLLTSLRQRAASSSASWTALKERCDLYLTGSVEWPDGNDYPDGGSIGEGYQGSGYFAALANLGLCYQVALGNDPTAAAGYGKKGAAVLQKMSAPYGSGQHGENPLRDDGYGVRFYGTGMALGFDWFFPALGSTLRTRIAQSLKSWLGAYENGGFERDFPQGNYFAGYYDAKALAGLALSGSTPDGETWWNDWLNRVQGTMVQPYYSANLSGGGWPEGWNYGPLGTLNMSWPVLAAKTALGLDLVHASGAPYLFPTASPRFLLYFTWPDLLTLEDSGFVYEGDEPTPARPSLFEDEAGLLEAFGDPFASKFHSFAQDVRSAGPLDPADADTHLWEDFLFWNSSAPTSAYTGLPLSFLAKGSEMGAVRSSWAKTAVWGAFTGGPHVNFPDAGEELPDKGSLAIVRGGRNFLVNAWAALLRNTPGTEDGGQYFNPLYDNVFNGNRDVFNVFYAGASPYGQGTYLRSDGNRSQMTRFEDGGPYVAMRAAHLEDNYPQQDGQTKTISSWTRDVVYLRPELFVVYDRTSVSSNTVPQRLAFHLARRITQGASPASGVGRFDVGSGTAYAGTVETVLPAGHQDTVAGLFGTHKIDRLTVAAGAPAKDNRWLTVFDPAQTAAEAATAKPLTHANNRILLGAMLGVSLHTSARNYAVLAGAGGAAPVSGEVRYSVPAALTRHVVTDLAPKTSYTVQASVDGADLVVDLAAGPGLTTSATGVVSFQTAAAGAVSP